MEIFTETRGRFNDYEVNCYRIEITEEMRSQALLFAENIKDSNNQYSRLLPTELKHNPNTYDIRQLEIQRTFIGKLGELVFVQLLKYKNKSFDIADMFEIFEGQYNTDSYDFITKNNDTVDIKTGFLSNHKRLLINEQQFTNIPKTYYVAVKLHCSQEFLNTKTININSIEYGDVLGYADRNFLLKIQPKDFGEGLARHIMYSKLMGIDKLVDKF